MNQRAISLWFCVLLASTFFHETSAKASITSSNSITQILKVVQKNSKSKSCDQPRTCRVVCDGESTTTESPDDTTSTTLASCDTDDTTTESPDDTTSTTLASCDTDDTAYGVTGIGCERNNIFAVANLTVNAALIIDVTGNQVLLLNGNTSAAVVIKISTGSNIYVSTGAWKASETSLEDFVTSLSPGCSSILKLKSCVEFQPVSCPKTISKEIETIVSNLIFDVDGDVQDDPEEALQLATDAGRTLIYALRGPIKGVLELFKCGKVLAEYRQDLPQFLNLFDGFDVIYGNIPGGYQTLVKAGVQVDLSIVTDAKSGAELLAKKILLIGSAIGFPECLRDTLNDNTVVDILLGQLGGYSNFGNNGSLKVLAFLARFLNGDVPLEVLITVLIQFLVSNAVIPCQEHPGQALYAAFLASLTEILDAVEEVNATETLSGLVANVKALQSDKYIINEVDLYPIRVLLVDGLDAGPSTFLEVIVGILYLLQPVVDITVAVRELLIVLILNLNSCYGIELLKGFGIDLGELTCDSIPSILKSAAENITDLDSDLYDTLVDLPVIGTIVEDMDTAISSLDISIDLKTIVNSCTELSGFFKAYFELLVGVECDAQPTDIKQCEDWIDTCTSTATYLSVNITVTIRETIAINVQ